MSRNVYLLLCLLLFCGWINPLSVQSEENVLNLSDALTLAYEQNPQMVQARTAIKAAEGNFLTAKTWENIKVNAEIGGLKKDENGSRRGHLDTLTFKQPFDAPGVHCLKKEIAENDIEIQNQVLKEVWSGVYHELRSVYMKLILNNKELELKRNNLKSMRQFFSDVQVQYQSGQTLKNHMQRAKIELLKTESDYLKVENALDIDKARLNLLLGRERDVAFEVRDELGEEQLAFNLDQLIDIALTKRPDLKAQQINLDSKKKQVRQQQLSRLPSYALGFQMVDEEFEEDYAAIIEISLPLWNLNKGEIKKSKAERDLQQTKVEALRNEIAFDVYAAYKDAQLAVKQLDLYKQSLNEANEMFRLASLRYGEGHIDFLNYLDQLRASLDSRMQYYQGLYLLNQNISKLEVSIYSSLRKEEFLQ